MTDEELAAIRKRLNAATPGPWHIGWIDENGLGAEVEAAGSEIVCHVNRRNDEGLIAHAPTDIAALIKEVERLRQNDECECGEGDCHWCSRPDK